MKSVIVGTAGHIDHGKTALVKALTGIDADRLEEEKRRGITIDIGFAHLELPAPDGSRLRLGFVDVPGHERFVRNMLAGVGGIDMVLLVIAADEGIKPQTREHFDICRLLAIRRGITVLTKSDAVDAETLEVVRLEVEDYVRGSFLDACAVTDSRGKFVDRRRPKRTESRTGPRHRRSCGQGFGSPGSSSDRSCLHHERVRHGRDRHAGCRDDPQRKKNSKSFPQASAVRVRGVQVHGSPAEAAVAGSAPR